MDAYRGWGGEYRKGAGAAANEAASPLSEVK